MTKSKGVGRGRHYRPEDLLRLAYARTLNKFRAIVPRNKRTMTATLDLASLIDNVISIEPITYLKPDWPGWSFKTKAPAWVEVGPGVKKDGQIVDRLRKMKRLSDAEERFVDTMAAIYHLAHSYGASEIPWIRTQAIGLMLEMADNIG